MKKLIFLLIVTSLLTSCSKDDDNNASKVESTTLVADGVKKIYNQQGRGITIDVNSYELELNFGSASDPFQGETLDLFTRYKKTGKNKIENLYYSSDYKYYHATEDLQSHITVNNRKQFSATFSGTFVSDEGETVTITEGSINTIYDEPFESTWGVAN